MVIRTIDAGGRYSSLNYIVIKIRRSVGADFLPGDRRSREQIKKIIILKNLYM